MKFTRKIADHTLAILRDPGRREGALLNLSLYFNLVYALFKLIVGLFYHSYWMIGLGAYYGLLAGMRFLLLRRLPCEGETDGWKSYRLTGALLLVLSVVISGQIAQTFLLPTTYAFPGVLIFAFAAYAFFKIISVSLSLIRRRHHEDRILAAARCVSFAHALMSILALQTALLDRYGMENPQFARYMNGIVGAVICILVIALSIFMLFKAHLALKSENTGAC
ncbi:MAG: hypothetical protein K5922_07535 [Clostridiales bacterium]|nr:hypothetical protein [Clostridiales bacterium]